MKRFNVSNDVRMWYLWEYIHFPKHIMLLFLIQTQCLDFFHCIQRLSFSLSNEVDISKWAMPYFLLEFVPIHRCLPILLQLKVKIAERISLICYIIFNMFMKICCWTYLYVYEAQTATESLEIYPYFAIM